MVIPNREQNLQQQFEAVWFNAVWSISSLFSSVVQNRTWPTLLHSNTTTGPDEGTPISQSPAEPSDGDSLEDDDGESDTNEGNGSMIDTSSSMVHTAELATKEMMSRVGTTLK